MADNPFDKAGRTWAKLDPVGVAGWLLGVRSDAFRFREWLDTRTLARSDEQDLISDTVAWVEDIDSGGVPWLLCVEFQIDPDPDILWRFLATFGRFGRQLRPTPRPGDRFHLAGVVVNLRGNGNSNRDATWPAAGIDSRYPVRDVNVATLDAETTLAAIESGDAPDVLLPLIPLMENGDDIGVMARWLAKASAADTKRRLEYEWITLVFAEAANRQPAWAELLEGWNVIRSKVVDAWIEEGRVEGRVEGRAEGMAIAVVALLESRFGAAPTATADAIRATTDLDTLKTWLTEIQSAATLDAFRSATKLP